MKEWIGYILAIIFLVTSIVIHFVYSGKLDDMQVIYSNEIIESSISASDNSYSVYEFSDYEFKQEVIDANAYANTLQQLIQAHDSLIEMVKSKSFSETNEDVVSLAIQFLEVRKDAYSNLKSYVDLSAENFVQVAENKFNESDELKNQLLLLLDSYEIEFQEE